MDGRSCLPRPTQALASPEHSPGPSVMGSTWRASADYGMVKLSQLVHVRRKTAVLASGSIGIPFAF